MQYRRLGNTGLKVSEISLGSWLTYGGYVEEQNAVSSIDLAYESGINFFDTANVYIRGEAEKVVGKALSKYPRSSYVLISTKTNGFSRFSAFDRNDYAITIPNIRLNLNIFPLIKIRNVLSRLLLFKRDLGIFM
jgi:aryl-alcohol dehydrogenase-like predicted oxidoreductase